MLYAFSHSKQRRQKEQEQVTRKKNSLTYYPRVIPYFDGGVKEFVYNHKGEIVDWGTEEEVTLRQSIIEAVKHCKLNIPDKHKEVLLLASDGYTVEEISKMFNVHQTTVTRWLRKAGKQLKAIIGEQDNG
jgi:DNA-directed RNA polymerase specialized sigma24 family protein